MKRAQLSLEALLSLAAYLALLSVLALSAEKMGRGLSEHTLASSERYSLAYQALCLDTAAGSLRSATIAQGFSAVPSQNGQHIRSAVMPKVAEPLFHAVSASQSGGVHVQMADAEPV